MEIFMTVLGLINFIAYVDTKIKRISHDPKICRSHFKNYTCGPPSG